VLLAKLLFVFFVLVLVFDICSALVACFVIRKRFHILFPIIRPVQPVKQLTKRILLLQVKLPVTFFKALYLKSELLPIKMMMQR
jgi:hypothetical protein